MVGVNSKGLVLFSCRWMASKEEMAVFNSYVYNHYQNGKETNYFLSTDRINAVAVLPLNKVRAFIFKFSCHVV